MHTYFVHAGNNGKRRGWREGNPWKTDTWSCMHSKTRRDRDSGKGDPGKAGRRASPKLTAPGCNGESHDKRNQLKETKGVSSINQVKISKFRILRCFVPSVRQVVLLSPFSFGYPIPSIFCRENIHVLYETEFGLHDRKNCIVRLVVELSVSQHRHDI
jgi:hypothetical protein